jgi:hydrogenase maturation protein HypF
MNLSYHIQISGLVQGVGFRPFIYRLAQSLDINGHVSNTNAGVSIDVYCSSEQANDFYSKIIQQAPINAIIQSHSIEEVSALPFADFQISNSISNHVPSLLLTPDIGICKTCKSEFNDANSSRYHYAFNSCCDCGPRYSIINALPYDRVNTTMHAHSMCPTCQKEYNDASNRRYYSQTDSCTICAIPMHLYQTKDQCQSSSPDVILKRIQNYLYEGKIIAVKSTGGYLLMCDATQKETISRLRQLKHRPTKPFAILYPSIESIEKDVKLTQQESEALESNVAPIVLCELKAKTDSGLCTDLIAPKLNKLGVMLPSNALLLSISSSINKPLVATSANISGSPIIYKDSEALAELFHVADFVLTYDRDIVVPQDDSVIQFTKNNQQIILRRSRGLAPNYFPNPLSNSRTNVLAMGAELKGSFALTTNQHLYVSQFLGDQGTLESQESFRNTLQHISSLLQYKAELVLVDKHPNYAVSKYGEEFAQNNDLDLIKIQHHKAHFASVLLENNKTETEKPILGFIWDGTGFGDDEQIWGGEVMLYHNSEINRITHLEYFPHLLGDKMSKEPRISALSLLSKIPHHQDEIKKHFNEVEWKYYCQLQLNSQPLQTSSMGRFLDAIACLLDIVGISTYEGEAAMLLESLAAQSKNRTKAFYKLPYFDHTIHYETMLTELIQDKHQGMLISDISYKVFYSLVQMIKNISIELNISEIAFSGGVFQNALLVELIIDELKETHQLYFHKQLSANDECIAFGQIAYHTIINQFKTEQYVFSNSR